MPHLQIEAIALAPLIVATIEAAKYLGLPKRYAPWLNASLSVAGYALMVAIQRQPDLLEPTTLLLNALVIFLTAAGFYDRAQALAKGK